MHQPAQRKLTSQNTCKRIQREEDRESPFFLLFFFLLGLGGKGKGLHLFQRKELLV